MARRMKTALYLFGLMALLALIFIALGMAMAAYWLPSVVTEARELVQALEFELNRLCTAFGVCGVDAAGVRWPNA